MKRFALSTAALLMALSPALAEEACGLCSSEVVMTSSLAKCFLSQYAALEGSGGAAIVVDLSTCASPEPAQRGVVEALPSPMASAPAPEMEFIVSRGQLGCLKEKLQEPGLVLDPSATIKLDACDGQTNGN